MFFTFQQPSALVCLELAEGFRNNNVLSFICRRIRHTNACRHQLPSCHFKQRRHQLLCDMTPSLQWRCEWQIRRLRFPLGNFRISRLVLCSTLKTGVKQKWLVISNALLSATGISQGNLFQLINWQRKAREGKRETEIVPEAMHC